MTTTTINTETITTAETIPSSVEIETSSLTILQTPVVIEPTPAQDVIPTPPNQPVVTTITTVTLPISLPIQTISGP